MEEISHRLQNALGNIYVDLDKEVIRKMQLDMYMCNAKCYENTTASVDDVTKCVKNCTGHSDQAQTYLQQEIDNMRDRMNRCTKDCQVRNKITTDMSETQQLQLREEMESCVGKCADDNIKMLPDIYKRMKNDISAMK